MLKLFKILQPDQKRRFFNVLFLMVLVGFFEMVSIGSVLPLLGTVTNQKTEIQWVNDLLSSYIGKLNELKFLIILCVIIMVTFLLKSISIYFYTKYVSKFMFFLSLDQQKKTFEKYLDYNFTDIFNKDSSKILSDINIESKMIAAQFVSPLLTVLLNSSTLFFLIFFMFLYNFKITLMFAFFSIIIFILFNTIYQSKLKKLGLERIYQSSEVVKSIKNTFDGIRELIIYDKVRIYSDKFLEKVTSLSYIGIKRSIISITPKLIIETGVISLILISILFSNIYFKIELIDQISLISVYILVGFRFLPILLSLITNYQKLNFSASSVDLIFNILKKKNNREFKKKISFQKEINFRNLCFFYGKKKIINNFSTKIKKNTIVGLFGKSGSGKSTLVDILFGLRLPTSGEIFIDKKNTKNYSCNYLFSYVQQKVHILDNSLLKNITFEDDLKNVDIKKLNYSLKFAELDNVVNTLKNGIYTNLGQFGNKLSGGQLQRVGIARAIYRDTEILILDEALNSVDSISKKIILKNIFNLNGYKTVIYISHNISELKLCNKIIKF